MIFEITNCNLVCWDCPRDCEMKKMFLLPEPIFNYQIIESLKFSSGMYIVQGGNLQVANEEMKKTAVALSISRKKYLENH